MTSARTGPDEDDARRVAGQRVCVGVRECVVVVGGSGGGGDVGVDVVGSHLSHSWVLFHFGHSPEQTWWGRGRGDLQDPAEVGGVNGGLLWVEQ